MNCLSLIRCASGTWPARHATIFGCSAGRNFSSPRSCSQLDAMETLQWGFSVRLDRIGLSLVEGLIFADVTVVGFQIHVQSKKARLKLVTCSRSSHRDTLIGRVIVMQSQKNYKKWTSGFGIKKNKNSLDCFSPGVFVMWPEMQPKIVKGLWHSREIRK